VTKFLSAQGVLPQDGATTPALDRIRLAEAFEICEKLGDQIWKGWTQAPFSVLLITPANEFLVCDPRRSADFSFVSDDSIRVSREETHLCK